MTSAIHEEWARAWRCLASSELLLNADDSDSAVSRAYYAVFNGATAYFLCDGLEFGKHEAVESAVHRDLVRTGKLPITLGASYSRLRELRMVGDYGTEDHVALDDAREPVILARAFLEELRRVPDSRLP